MMGDYKFIINIYVKCIYFMFENVHHIHGRFPHYAIFKVVVDRFYSYCKVCSQSPSL